MIPFNTNARIRFELTLSQKKIRRQAVEILCVCDLLRLYNWDSVFTEYHVDDFILKHLLFF